MARHHKMNYQLEDGTRINGSDVIGFIHKARKDIGFDCTGCGEPIKKNQEYMDYNIPFNRNAIPTMIFHSKCYDNPNDCFIGIKRKVRKEFGHIKSTIICKKLSQQVTRIT